MGSFCKGDSLSTSSNFSTPLVTSKSSGLRFLTTDFAAPWSFCHMRGAASFLSLSFRERSYHLQLVAKESNELGSPSHIGTSVCSGIRARTGSSPRPNQLLRYHAIGQGDRPNSRPHGCVGHPLFLAQLEPRPIGRYTVSCYVKRIMQETPVIALSIFIMHRMWCVYDLI